MEMVGNKKSLRVKIGVSKRKDNAIPANMGKEAMGM